MDVGFTFLQIQAPRRFCALVYVIYGLTLVAYRVKVTGELISTHRIIWFHSFVAQELSFHPQVRMDVPVGDSRYTLVASQSKRAQDLNVTMQAWSTVDFSMTALPLTSQYSASVSGEWTPESSGIFNDANPRIVFSIPAKSNVVVKLLAQPKIATAVSFHGKASDEPYRFGMSVLEMSVLEAGEYTLVVSTFEKLDMSQAFLLVVETDGCKATARRIQ